MRRMLVGWSLAALLGTAAFFATACSGPSHAGGRRVKVNVPKSLDLPQVSRKTGDNRRGIEQSYITSPRFGGARGRKFEDIIPVGARITAIHVMHSDRIHAVWLTYERHGIGRDTPKRGTARGKHEVFMLDKNEKIIGMHAYGRGTVDELVIATNKRVVSLGDGKAPGLGTEQPWYETLSEEDKRRYVTVGIAGRADEEVRQLALRIQVKEG